MQESHIASFTVEGDIWNTLWLVQKTINEGEKKEVPVSIEIKSGSVSTTISVAADALAIGTVLYKVIEYIRKKRQQEKPLRITRFDRDVAYAYVLNHLNKVASAEKTELRVEHPTKEGGYFFEFIETISLPLSTEFPSIFRHTYTISQDFDACMHAMCPGKTNSSPSTKS